MPIALLTQTKPLNHAIRAYPLESKKYKKAVEEKCFNRRNAATGKGFKLLSMSQLIS